MKVPIKSYSMSEITQYTPHNSEKGMSQRLNTLSQGRVKPNASELEELVIGAMLIDKKGVDEAIELLKPEVFYVPAHQHIFDAIKQLFSESKPVDLLTVSEQLKTNGDLSKIGGNVYLVDLTHKVASSAHIEYHAHIILEKYILRELITISAETVDKAFDNSSLVFNLLDEVEQRIYDLHQNTLKRSFEGAQSLVIKALKRIEDVARKEGLSGVPSGFQNIDNITSGWQNSDLIIIAARPGMGKTAFTLSMAINMAIKHEQAVALFSLEMSSIQLITRMISSETEISSEKLRTGKLEKHEWEQLHTKIKSLEAAPIYIDDTPQLSIHELRAKARRLCSQHQVKVILVDYLQLMTLGSGQYKGGNREQEISMISRSLKALAKELDVPIITLSQLSRAVETRGGSKRPILSDLRESGAIEQDADIVSFIYRPEYYGIEEWDDDERSATINQAEFIISKHRNGRLDNIKIKFTKHLGKFEDFDLSISMEMQQFESKINTRMDDPINNHYDNLEQNDDIPF